MPDIGADQIRVFKYDQQQIAPLQELAPLRTESGTGPRHTVFWTSPEGGLFLFFNGELDQRIYSYRVRYTGQGLEWSLVSSIVSVSEALPETTSPTSEIAVTVSPFTIYECNILM